MRREMAPRYVYSVRGQLAPWLTAPDPPWMIRRDHHRHAEPRGRPDAVRSPTAGRRRESLRRVAARSRGQGDKRFSNGAHRLGWPTIAFGFLAGEIGVIAQRALDNEGVPHHFVPVPGQPRLNVTVVDGGEKTSTSFYGPGPPAPRPPLYAPRTS
jgi:hypothetical protein